MGRRRIISRIHKFIPRELMFKLNEVCRGHFGHNNSKIDMIIKLLDEFGVDYVKIGGGTNRYCVKIDGYIFKFAMDIDGVNDNMLEFSMSRELQPYVTKTYECNGLIAVAEYVNVIRKEEFLNNKDNIRGVLSNIADRFLFDDVGITTKNYLNWGYRDSGELVILDYGYAYRVTGQEMVCGTPIDETHNCDGFLDYNQNFTMLVCPKCGRKYNIGDIRRRISQDYERLELERSKASAHLLTSAYLDIDVDDPTDNKEEITMDSRDRELTPEEREALYEQALALCKNLPEAPAYAEAAPAVDDVEDDDEDYSNDYTCGCDDDDDDDENEAMSIPYKTGFLFGDIPFLFTTDRVNPEELPDNVFKYDIRSHEEEDVPVSIEHHVIMNYYGAIITAAELVLGADGKVAIKSNDIYIDYYSEAYLSEFIDKYVNGVFNPSVDIDDGLTCSEPTEMDAVVRSIVGDHTEDPFLKITIGDEDDDDEYDDDDEFDIDPDDVDYDGEFDDDDEYDDATSLIVNSDNIRDAVADAVEAALPDIVDSITDEVVDEVTDLRDELADALAEEESSDDDDTDEVLNEACDTCLIDNDVIAEALAEEEEETHNRRNKNYKHKKNH